VRDASGTPLRMGRSTEEKGIEREEAAAAYQARTARAFSSHAERPLTGRFPTPYSDSWDRHDNCTAILRFVSRRNRQIADLVRMLWSLHANLRTMAVRQLH
jgi:hypothetical protein